MWFKKRKKEYGIAIILSGSGDNAMIQLDIRTPQNPEDMHIFTNMLVMLNRGKLIPTMIMDIQDAAFDGHESVIKQLSRIPENRRNIGDKPHPMIAPDKVSCMDLRRLQGDI